MQRAIRVCFYNTDEASGEQIRNALQDIPQVQVVAESSEWHELRDSISATPVDMVLVNLDPDIEQSLKIVQFIVQAAPEMGIIGVSGESDPQTIIRAMRTGCTQFVCSPIEIDDLNNAIARITATRTQSPSLCRRICVVGSTGGVGATTIACNLALELAQVTERPCALVDLNLEFGDVAAAFDCKPAYSVADLCADGGELDGTIVDSAMHRLPGNMHLLARPQNMEDAHRVAPELVERLLNLLTETYQNVVLDLPRGFNFFNAAAVDRADLILIVAQLSVPSIRNARRVHELFLQMNVAEDNLQIVLNRYKAEFERITLADVEQHFARPVFALIPNDYRRVRASLDLGQPILADSPKSPARLAINEMARKIASESRSHDFEGADRKGFFGRLWNKKQPVD
jgi:pilus assembly protein CpaE